MVGGLRDRYERAASGLRRLARAVAGDRLGAVVFLAALCFLALTWRVGVFINDNYTIANAVVAVADGGLSVDRIVYGPPSGATPGMHRVGGELYGRNYGHVLLAVPFVFFFEALAAVADLPVALSALWSLLLLALALQVGRLTGRVDAAAPAGSALALLAFAGNVAFARPLADRWAALLGLQAATMVAAALACLVLYRLCRELAGRRVGVAAGLGLALATPYGFWAVVPKRHAVTGLLAALVLHSFLRARRGDDVRFRALSYAWVGLAAWVHAAEGLVLLVALAAVDVPTAPRNDRRALAAVAGALLVSLLPFFLTNLLVAGNPIEPPRMTPSYGGGGGLLSGGESGGSGGGAGGAGSGGSGTLLPAWFVGLFGSALGKLGRLYSLFAASADAAVTQPERLYHTFLRSGYIAGVAGEDANEAVTMSLLESMPLLGALVALPVAAARRRLPDFGRPATAVAVLAGAQVLCYTFLFASRLPTHATVTVRYLVPAVPALVVLLVRCPPVVSVVADAHRTLAWTYAATVLFGVQVLLAVVVATGAGTGEAVQFHALLGLAVAVPLAGWAVFAARPDGVDPRAGAVLLGAAAGLTTDFLLLSAWVYFAYMGQFALPAVGRLAAAAALGG